MSRLIIVSNRVAPIEEGKPSSGGLSVAVEEALRETGGLWFGWSGKIDGSSNTVTSHEGPAFTTATMPLSRRDYRDYYMGYSNSTLWPLMHYRLDLVAYTKEFAAGYRRVNELFAGKLSPFIQKNDLVWVHDYHLFLMARELKRLGIKNRLGFFLHTPFPPADLLMACTDHEAIVRALMDFDVIGFQTEIDARNFQEYIRRLPDGRVKNNKVSAYGKDAIARAFPIGIHPDEIADQAARAAGSYQSRHLLRSLGEKDLIIGVDRLDYSKGLDNRFAAYDRLLADYPENRGSVSFMQVAPPSRGDVASYQEIRERLEGMAGNINGRYSDFDWVPLRYLNKSFQRDILVGFFRVARIGLVTPLRDGMNLVAKEYVAAQDPEDPGILVLSQFAGAAEELTSAVIVNPYDIEATSHGLQTALSMRREERQERYQAMMRSIRRNNLDMWRKRFVRALAGT